MVGLDENDYSYNALKWMIDELVDDGDEIVCLRVIDKGSELTSDRNLAEKKYVQVAKELIDQIVIRNGVDRAIRIVLEFAVGKLQATFTQMVWSFAICLLDTAD